MPNWLQAARGRVQAAQAVRAMRGCLMELLDAGMLGMGALLHCHVALTHMVGSATVHGKDEKDRVASVLINVLAVLSPSMKARYVARWLFTIGNCQHGGSTCVMTSNDLA